jgi:hypothetical protein
MTRQIRDRAARISVQRPGPRSASCTPRGDGAAQHADQLTCEYSGRQYRFDAPSARALCAVAAGDMPRA